MREATLCPARGGMWVSSWELWAPRSFQVRIHATFTVYSCFLWIPRIKKIYSTIGQSEVCTLFGLRSLTLCTVDELRQTNTVKYLTRLNRRVHARRQAKKFANYCETKKALQGCKVRVIVQAQAPRS